jgi:hypothetical protein
MLLSRRSTRTWLASALLAAVLVTYASSALAQIKEPGRHRAYSIELEPHLLMQFDRTWGARGVGYGPGFRATLPILQNGPIPKINNSLGIGAGLDWSIFNDCDGKAESADCTVNQVWVPVVAQWSFFFTPIVSAFAELGASLTNRKLDYSKNCPFVSDSECQKQNFSWFQPVLFVGGRFSFSKTAGLLVRLGTPYLSIGADFTL